MSARAPVEALKYDEAGNRIGRSADYVTDFLRDVERVAEEVGVDRVLLMVGRESPWFARENVERIRSGAAALGVRVEDHEKSGIWLVEDVTRAA